MVNYMTGQYQLDMHELYNCDLAIKINSRNAFLQNPHATSKSVPFQLKLVTYFLKY